MSIFGIPCLVPIHTSHISGMSQENLINLPSLLHFVQNQENPLAIEMNILSIMQFLQGPKFNVVLANRRQAFAEIFQWLLLIFSLLATDMKEAAKSMDILGK